MDAQSGLSCHVSDSQDTMPKVLLGLVPNAAEASEWMLQSHAQIEEVQGVLASLKSRTAGLELRLHEARHPTGLLTGPEHPLPLSDNQLALPSQHQLEK